MYIEEMRLQNLEAIDTSKLHLLLSAIRVIPQKYLAVLMPIVVIYITTMGINRKNKLPLWP